MPLIPYRHFEDIDRWFDEDWPGLWGRAGRWLPRAARGLAVRAPKVNVYEEGSNVIAEVEMPGIDPKNIDVEVKKDLLTVEARQEEKTEEKKKGYYRKEISHGYLKRVVPLPVEVKEDKADASYQKGVLKVIMPKAAPKKQADKKVKVKVKTA